MDNFKSHKSPVISMEIVMFQYKEITKIKNTYIERINSHLKELDMSLEELSALLKISLKKLNKILDREGKLRNIMFVLGFLETFKENLVYSEKDNSTK